MAKNTEKDRQMAANLRANGIFHGKRQGSGTNAPSIPVNEPGSAAYRRIQRKLVK
jgi:hypothetical protein